MIGEYAFQEGIEWVYAFPLEEMLLLQEASITHGEEGGELAFLHLAADLPVVGLHSEFAFHV